MVNLDRQNRKLDDQDIIHELVFGRMACNTLLLEPHVVHNNSKKLDYHVAIVSTIDRYCLTTQHRSC